jgi:hypothetical protein
MKLLFFLFGFAILLIFTGCDTFKNLPTNTSGGVFSLNGNWQLVSTNDNSAMEGTVVTVIPGFSDGTARTLNNNTYCLRERDAIWQKIKGREAGVFIMESLVNACNGKTVYQPATVTVLTNDEIRVTTRTAASGELIQTWKRVPNQ